jgi:hypothetical protein
MRRFSLGRCVKDRLIEKAPGGHSADSPKLLD